MKIPLNVKYKDRYFPNKIVTILGSHAPSSILVVIDTGSEKTILSYKDALQLQIPVKESPIKENVQGISRQKLALCEYKKRLIFCLKKEDETSFRINVDDIYISTDPLGLPVTIIGMNFLKENNLKLFYDPNGDSYLKTLE